jgi:adenylate cyclase
MTHSEPAILVVDDDENNRYTLTQRLRRQGYENVTVATNGRDALDSIGKQPFDLILLDIMMPEMNGYEVLERLKRDDKLRHIPVIMISALTELDSVVRCIELGAEDYLPKPFNNVLLGARIGASLERKRLHDREAQHLAEIDRQRVRADELLHAILPAAAVRELRNKDRVSAKRYDDVTVLFGDLVGFTSYCERNPPDQVVACLDRLVAEFEEIAARHRLEKIKTMGDAFMATGNLLEPHPDPVMASIGCAFDMAEAAHRNAGNWQLRIGIHIGPVVAGVIGRTKFNFDIWGDTVNVAARLSQFGSEGAVYLTGDAWQRVKDRCAGDCLGPVPLKGKGELEVYLCRPPDCARAAQPV